MIIERNRYLNKLISKKGNDLIKVITGIRRELHRRIAGDNGETANGYYIFLDEIQKVSEIQNPYVDDPQAKIGFVDVLLGLMKIKNVDLYVTGSNSRMFSSDILTEFRGRGDEIRVNPLTYSEFYSAG